MTLIDEGLMNGLVWGHVDYHRDIGRPITQSQNRLERDINPELTPEERNKLSGLSSNRRNETHIHLYSENNMRIVTAVRYNPITEALAMSWSIYGSNGKRAFRLNPGESVKEKRKYVKSRSLQHTTNLLCENNVVLKQRIGFNPVTDEITLTSGFTAGNGKKLFRLN